MKTSDFDYLLQKEHIAQSRIYPYHNAKLLVLDKVTGEIEDRHFYDILDYIDQNDVLIFNNTKVFKARLIGQKQTKGSIEVLLLEPPENENVLYECLTKGHIKIDDMIIFDQNLIGIIKEILPNGNRKIQFNQKGDLLKKSIETIGSFPLPHYIESSDPKVKEDYQTVYADNNHMDSIAAPTAGFHFTKELIMQIEKKSVKIEYITLTVGIGTFRPVKTNDIEEHEMHHEKYSIDHETKERLNAYKKQGKRIIAVGTTSIRTLEDSVNESGILEKDTNNTNIFIYPPYKFKFVDAVITNFHLPKSTLLMLVSAFATREIILHAYKHALEHDYRFYSLGDAMFIHA